MQLDKSTGLVDEATFIASPNCDEREHSHEPEVIILHCISLPPGEYGGDEVNDFFCNRLDSNAHPYFEEISGLTVSSHFLIRRDGELIQYVPTTKRAWHAGESCCLGRPQVNNFSVGIELEGLDTDPRGFTDAQYDRMAQLLDSLYVAYPALNNQHLFAHSDIAPGRKTDPGPHLDWDRVLHQPALAEQDGRVKT